MFGKTKGSPLSIKDAVVLGVKRSPLVEAAKHSTKALEAELFKARSLAWPTAEIYGLVAPMPAQRGNAVKGHTDMGEWGYFVYGRIEGYVPIYTFGKISALKDAAKYGIDAGRYRERIAVIESAGRIEALYIAAQVAEATLDALKEGKKYLEKAERHLKELEESDDPDFDPMDKAKFVVYKNQYLTYKVQASTGVRKAKEALEELLGIEGLRVEELRPFDWKERDLGYFIRKALEGRPEVKALHATLNAKRMEVSARKAAFYPDFIVGGRFTIGHSNVADPQDSPFANDPFNTYSGGGFVGMRMGLDIGKKIAELRKARAGLAELEAKYRALIQGVKIQVRTAYQSVKEAYEEMGYARKAMKAARGWAIGEADLYDNGFCGIKDVIDAVAAFYKAKFEYYKAVGKFNMAVLQLEHAAGICRFCEEVK